MLFLKELFCRKCLKFGGWIYGNKEDLLCVYYIFKGKIWVNILFEEKCRNNEVLKEVKDN